MKAILLKTTDDSGHHGCTLVNRQIRLLAGEAGIDIVARLPLYSDWDARAPDDFDAVIVNGEGTLHSANKGARRTAAIADWAAGRSRPAYLINTVYQNNSAEIAEQVRRFTSVYTRDPKSASELSAIGVSAKVVPDLSLSWQTEPAGERGRTIINGSTIAKVRESLYRASGPDRPYLPILSEPPRGSDRRSKFLLKRWISLFAPPGLWRARYRNAIPAFDDFAAYLKSEASGVVTGRFHMAAISLCLEIPVLALPSMTHKIEALFEEAGIADRILTDGTDLKAIDPPPFTDAELESIRAFRAGALAAARACFSEIAGSV